MKTMGMVGAASIFLAGMLLAGGCAGPMAAKGCWTFNEGRGEVVKNSAGTNHGRIQGGLTWTEGKRGKALSFNGRGYVLIDSAPYLSSPQYTFTAWVKLKPTGDYHYIVWRGGPEFPEPRECRNLDIWVRKDGGLSAILDYQKGRPRFLLEGRTKVADDQWHLVALVVDGKTARFYVDGKKDAEGALAGPLAENDFPLWVGARPANVAATGVIDEVRFFDRALTEEEIAALK